MGRSSTLESPVRPPAPPIDPRIRARRIEVRRDQGRRRLQRLVDVGVVVAVALGFVAALFTPLLDVDEVQVRGARHLDPQLVRERADIALGDPLVRVDLHAVGTRVAALAWVQEVRLARGLGGTVTIEVQERTPVAAIGAGAQAVLVDREGRVLGPVAEAGSAAPVLSLVGAGSPPPLGGFLDVDASDALALAGRLAEAVPGAVAALRVEDLVGTLAQGGEVRFGTGSQLDAKVRSLRTVLDQVDLSCLAVLDLRLPGSPVLTREERCS